MSDEEIDDWGESSDECECCGGEGFVELQDHPELWSEDFFSEKNKLVTCPECGGNGF